MPNNGIEVSHTDKAKRYGEIKSHITIEEAKKRGLWKIVNQLEKDKKTRQSLGMRPLQAEIKEPVIIRGRPKLS